MFQFIKDKLKINELNKEVERLKAEIEKVKENEIVFGKDEITYLRHLMLEDEIINGQTHGVAGLYSEFNIPLSDMQTEIRTKLEHMERKEPSKRLSFTWKEIYKDKPPY